MSMTKYEKTKKNPVDKIFYKNMLALTIITVIYSIIIITKKNKVQWKKEIYNYNNSDIGNKLYNNINLTNNKIIIDNINSDFNNQLVLSLGFAYAVNNELLHHDLDNGTSYLFENELLSYINEILPANTVIMEDLELDGNTIKYNYENHIFLYDDSNVEKSSKIYSILDDDYIYIYEYSAYTNLNLVKDNIYPNSYSSNDYDLGEYINNDNIGKYINTLDLNRILYVFKRDNDNYYLNKIETF